MLIPRGSAEPDATPSTSVGGVVTLRIAMTARAARKCERTQARHSAASFRRCVLHREGVSVWSSDEHGRWISIPIVNREPLEPYPSPVVFAVLFGVRPGRAHGERGAGTPRVCGGETASRAQGRSNRQGRGKRRRRNGVQVGLRDEAPGRRQWTSVRRQRSDAGTRSPCAESAGGEQNPRKEERTAATVIVDRGERALRCWHEVLEGERKAKRGAQPGRFTARRSSEPEDAMGHTVR